PLQFDSTRPRNRHQAGASCLTFWGSSPISGDQGTDRPEGSGVPPDPAEVKRRLEAQLRALQALSRDLVRVAHRSGHSLSAKEPPPDKVQVRRIFDRGL